MNKEMTIRKIPVSDINPAKYNPRKDLKPGDPVYEKLKRSMTEFGYVEPIRWPAAVPQSKSTARES